MARAPAKRKAANGYKLPDPLPKGEILEDVAKKSWKLGPSIGQGGFGEIYSAQEAGAGGAHYPYVIKIEPHANGPLFVERKFYITNAKPADVEAFKKEKGLKTFGMPTYLGSGTHECKGEKYRFLVMEKFGTDLWKIFLENDRILPATTVFKLAVQLLDVLEYIHKCGYIHADIKGANVLLGISKDTQNKQIYLVDFGLAAKFTEETEYKPNPKKAHDGTLEYLSRDAHQGVQTRRGDLEIMAYNLVQWLGCKLPWEHLKNPKDVQQSKEQYMKDIPKLIRTCFEKRTPPGPIVDFLNYILSLEFNQIPDYKKVRKILLSGLDSGDSLTKPFQFTATKKTPKLTPTKRKKNVKSKTVPKRKLAKQKHVEETSEDEKKNFDMDIDEKKNFDMDIDENDVVEETDVDEDDVVPEVSKRKPKGRGKKKRENNEQEIENLDNDSDVEEDVVLDVPKRKPKGSPQKKEVVVARSRGRPRKVINYNENSEEKIKVPRTKKTTRVDSKDVKQIGDNFKGYTSAMKEVLMKMQEKEKKKNGIDKDINFVDTDNTNDNTNGYNNEMKEIAKKLNKKKTKTVKNSTVSENPDMEGYNDEMKEITSKKKATTRKRKVYKEPEPSTSTNTSNHKTRKLYDRPVTLDSDSD